MLTQRLQERGAHTAGADLRRDTVGIVEQCENVRARQHAAQRLHHFLASAHIYKPVMDNCGAHEQILPIDSDCNRQRDSIPPALVQTLYISCKMWPALALTPAVERANRLS